MDILRLLLEGIYYILYAYFWVIIIYILLGWIPSIRQSKFYYQLHIIVSPFMDTFRGLLVIGMIDLTPMIGLFLYNIGLEYFSQFLGMI